MVKWFAEIAESMSEEHGPPASTMDTPATLQKCPASSPFNAEVHQPTASVGSISPPRNQRHLVLGPNPHQQPAERL